MSVEELVPAIRGSDLARLTRIPGVGRKTAERMVVELKDKLEAVTVETEKPAASSPAGIEADVISALVNLGIRQPRRGDCRWRSEARGGRRKFREIAARHIAILEHAERKSRATIGKKI